MKHGVYRDARHTNADDEALRIVALGLAHDNSSVSCGVVVALHNHGASHDYGHATVVVQSNNHATPQHTNADDEALRIVALDLLHDTVSATIRLKADSSLAYNPQGSHVGCFTISHDEH